MVQIPRQLVESFLRKIVPQALEVVSLFRENAEQDGLPPRIKQWISLYNVKDWANAYLEPKKLLQVHADGFSAIFGTPSTDSIQQVTEGMKIPEALLQEVWGWLQQFIDHDLDFEIPDSIEDNKDLQAIPEEDRQAYIDNMGKMLSACLILVMNYFSCMIYKKSMFQLVEEAIAGNEKSLLKAIHIDQSCLKTIEPIKNIVIDAALSPNSTLATRVQEWRSKPPLASSVELSGLYLIFMLLHLLGLLDQFAEDKERFALFCQSMNTYGPPADQDVPDIDSFSRTLDRFKLEFTIPALIPPKTLFVKDTV
jgi:hypothetical protein